MKKYIVEINIGELSTREANNLLDMFPRIKIKVKLYPKRRKSL